MVFGGLLRAFARSQFSPFQVEATPPPFPSFFICFLPSLPCPRSNDVRLCFQQYSASCSIFHFSSSIVCCVTMIATIKRLTLRGVVQLIQIFLLFPPSSPQNPPLPPDFGPVATYATPSNPNQNHVVLDFLYNSTKPLTDRAYDVGSEPSKTKDERGGFLLFITK